MSTFGQRLEFFLHTVRQLPRKHFARQLNTHRVSSPELAATLRSISVSDIRSWENDVIAPPSPIRAIVARVLGISIDLLDPDGANANSSADEFLEMSKQLGLKQKQIVQAWKVYKGGDLAFRGPHTPGDLALLLRTDPGLVLSAVQNDLFIDEYRCRDCGYWEDTPLKSCPECGPDADDA